MPAASFPYTRSARNGSGCGAGEGAAHWPQAGAVTGEDEWSGVTGMVEVTAQVEAVADRLYVLRPGEFTGARAEAVAAARAEGDRALARAVSALRRPTVAAWAANLLVRDQPEQADALLRLGEDMRQAQQGLAGARLRELTRQRRQVVGALARQAVRLSADAGQRIGAEAQRQVEETLHAVLADPDAAQRWAAGRLDRPLRAPSGFAAATGAADGAGDDAGDDAAPAAGRSPASRGSRRGREAGRAAKRPARKQAAGTAGGTASHGRSSTGSGSAAARERRDRVAKARRAAEDAARDLRGRENERAAADDAARQAAAAREAARERVAELTAELRAATDEQRAAEREERAARGRATRAARAEQRARDGAERAAARLERLGVD